jgi:rod shape-determining protein MreD
MRAFLLSIPLLILAAIAQSTVLYQVRFLNGHLDLILTIVVAWSLVQRTNQGPVWALVGGIATDTLSGGPPGATTLSLAAVAFVIALTEGRFYRANWPVALIASVLGTLIYHLLYLAILAANGYPVNFAEALATVTFPSAILNVLLMLPVYQTTKWLAVRVAPPKVELG